MKTHPTRRLLALVTLGALASAAALFACSSDDSGSGTGLDVGNVGTCQTSYPGDAGKYPLGALPSGQACTGPSSCILPVDTCAADLASANGGVNLTEYECDCLDGGWSCYAAVKVNTTCGDDGGVVATEDSGTEEDGSGDAWVSDASPDGADASDAGGPEADANGEGVSIDSGAMDAGVDASDAG